MDCNQYEALAAKYMDLTLPADVWQSQEYSEWCDHIHECSSCSDWYQERIVVSRGLSLADFPCVHVAYHASKKCDQHNDPWECDVTLVRGKDESANQFGIPVRDGGRSFIAIQFCPWCGTPLSEK